MAERGRPRSFDRDAALKRAMEVFWVKGYAGASMSELTSAMGINSPSLYAAFGCKEALFREATQLYLATEGQPIWSGVETAPSARAAVETMLRASAEGYSRFTEPRGCLITLSLTHGEDDDLHQELRRLRVANITVLQSRLERAIEQGELPKDANARAIADFYFTLQQGMSLRARDRASGEELMAIVDCAMRAWDGFCSPRHP